MRKKSSNTISLQICDKTRGAPKLGMASLQRGSEYAGNRSEVERAELARLKNCLHKVDGLVEFLGEIDQKAAAAGSERDRASERAAVAESERERLKEESEHLKKEIDELRKQQEILKTDNEKMSSLLSEERELRKEERKRMAAIIGEMEFALERKDENMQMVLKEEAERSEKEMGELHRKHEILRAEYQRMNTLFAAAEDLHLREETLATSAAEPGNIISALQVLPTKSAGNRDMQNILREELVRSEVKDWESLLAAAPNALSAIGECLTVGLSEKVDQITQKRDPSMYAKSHYSRISCS